VDTIFSIFSFLFGAVVGSFLNVVILRLPDPDQSIAFPASHCPRCNTPLHWYENIPIASYLVLRGRCRTCGEKISIQYPLVELGMGLLSLFLLRQFGPEISYLVYFVFVAALLPIIVIDIHHQIIPDLISLPGIVLGFIASFFIPEITWQQSALGILLGGGVLYGIALTYYLLAKRDGMGGGDIKLLAMIGAFLGWQSLLFVVFFSSLTGSIIGIAAMFKQKKGGRTRIPFGPFLATSAMAWLFFRPQILQLWTWYMSLTMPHGG
jgi:leader peptidase (prepilin peptidase)/N-methyltransferase